MSVQLTNVQSSSLKAEGYRVQRFIDSYYWCYFFSHCDSLLFFTEQDVNKKYNQIKPFKLMLS